MLVVEDKHHVRALPRALVSAKFSCDPHDRDVPASPLVAKLASEAATILEQLEVEEEGDVAADRWRVWKDLTSRRPEWKAAMSFAAEAFAEHWSAWSSEQRKSVLADLVAPYELSAASFDEFVRHLQARFDHDPQATTLG